jgi:hypothetical protein
MADKLPPSSSEDRPQLRPIDELAANDTRVRTRLGTRSCSPALRT